MVLDFDLNDIGDDDDNEKPQEVTLQWTMGRNKMKRLTSSSIKDKGKNVIETNVVQVLSQKLVDHLIFFKKKLDIKTST